ncbi:MAG: hypothetical protein R8L53_02825 [Mariprofundales bacterium]
MAGAHIILDDSAINQVLQHLLNAVTDLTPAMREIGEMLKLSHDDDSESKCRLMARLGQYYPKTQKKESLNIYKIRPLTISSQSHRLKNTGVFSPNTLQD